MGLTGLVLFMTTAASFCVPSDPFADAPVAIRRTPDGDIEASYVHCEGPDGVVEFGIKTQDPTIDPADATELVTVWEIEFDEPTVLDEIVLGEVPPGGQEKVAWPDGGFDDYPADAEIVARVRLDRYPSGSARFRLSDLEDGDIWFEGESLTPDEFADTDACRE